MSDDAPFYAELAPSPSLARFVRVIWTLDVPAEYHQPQTIVPDGCPEIVINLGDPVDRRHEDGALERHPRQLLVGQTTRGTVVEPSGRLRLAGVRMHPWAAAAFLGRDAGELADEIVPLGVAVSRSLAQLIDGAADGASPRSVAAMLRTTLERRANTLCAPDAMARAAVRRVMTSGEPLTVRALAAELGGSERRVQRIFRDAIGLSPKMFLRIARVQRATRMALDEARTTWASIAARCGYFDQAHLVRDFQHFAKTTPTRFRAETAPFTEHMLS